MLRTDTANFNRFLTSLGLLLVAAALLVPYFYFQSTDTLEIQAADLRGMTATARDALEGRQDAIVAIEAWVVVGAVTMALLGISLVVWGAFRLRAAQDSEDEETELRKRRAALEVEEMSPTEKARQVTEKAKAEVEQEGGVAAVKGDEVRAARQTQERTAMDIPAPGRTRTGVEASTTLWQSRILDIARVSDRIRGTFNTRGPLKHKKKWQIRIGSATDQVRLDGLFEARDDQADDVVLEIRVSSAPKSLSKNAGNIANDLIAKLSRYRVLTARPAKGWLVVVVPSESEHDLDPLGRSRATEALNSALFPFGWVSLLNERELDLLPGLFAQRFERE